MEHKLKSSSFLIAAALCVAWWVAAAQTVVGETSRADAIAQEQQVKSQHLSVEGPSRAERIVEWVQRRPVFVPTSGFYPWPKSVYPGTGVAVGAGFIQRWPNLAHVNMSASASIRGSSTVRGDVMLPPLAGGRVSVIVNGSHTIARDLSFYGLGPKSSTGGPLRYEYRPSIAGVTATLQAVPGFNVSGAYRRLEAKTKKTGGPDPTAASAPAIGTDLAYNVAEITASIDWRSSPGYSIRGGFHRFTASRYFEAHDLPYAFHVFEYEGIQLVPILRGQFVLAGRVLATLSTPEKGDRVPAVLMPTLGGPETLRGFKTRRFTDFNRLLLSAEYRWTPSRVMDMAIFLDAGKVEPERHDLNLSRLETDLGIGARFHSAWLSLFRAEVARSREGWKVMAAGGKAF